MITQNNKDLKLYNGDVGLVRRDTEKGLLAHFKINNQLESFPVGLIKDYQTVFAMTSHKSQGSEFNNVIVALPDQSDKMEVTKELLYTAVTRAKKQVLLLASDKAVENAMNLSLKRTSGLVHRLTK